MHYSAVMLIDMTPQQQLTKWVKLQHKGQLIPRTKLPYFDHLLRVAETAGNCIPLAYEIGLCHDLLEKTTVDAHNLQQALIGFGYTPSKASTITICTTELTDVFTKSAYPALSKAERKTHEATRLATISALAQTVKYADLMDNINWMWEHQPEKAEAYLKRKQALLFTMHKGDRALRAQTAELISHVLLAIDGSNEQE